MFAFVNTNQSGRIDVAERQLIRHHCMRRRNKQPGSRRSRREAIRAAAQSSLENQIQEERSRSQSHANRVSTGTGSAIREDPVRETCRIRLSPCHWALLNLTESLDVTSQELMQQYFFNNPIRDTQYPFHHFGISINFDDDPSNCLQWFLSDSLCFHAMLLVMAASDDLVAGRALSTKTYRHLRLTLPILNSRLSDPKQYKSDKVIYVISILASIAILFGDYAAAKTHATGLSKLVRLREDFQSASHGSAIQLSLDRLNFSSYLATRQWTPIYDSTIWGPQVISSQFLNEALSSHNMICVDWSIDADLSIIFHHLQYVTILLNRHYYDGSPVDGKSIWQCLGFIHSNLIELGSRRLEAELSTCFHLGMMIFLAMTFRLPGSNNKPRLFRELSRRFANSYANIQNTIADIALEMRIWLLLLLFMSAGDTIDDLHHLYYYIWQTMVPFEPSWDNTKRQLKRVLWIDPFHDELGRKAFNELTAKTLCVNS